MAVIGNARSLYDKFGRIHNYLRISLTERCNLRCTYCMPTEGISLTEKNKLLTIAEHERLSNVFVMSLGIDKIRLTGGEPTVDGKLSPLLEHFKTLRDYGLKTIAMTTNGLTLKRQAGHYKELGLNSVNISLDTLAADKFELMTRRKGWNLVMEGIESALEWQFDQVKLNCVVMRGFNDSELLDFCALAHSRPIDVRFIEFMPFLGNRWSSNLLVPFKEMLQRLQAKYPQLARLESLESPHDTSKIYKQPGMLGSIGFITSMTNNFCSGCNRLRLTADGKLKVCLFDQQETSLRDLMRNGASDAELVTAIRTALGTKKKQHADSAHLVKDVHRPMIKIDPDYSNNATFTHLAETGEAKMVGIGGKPDERRIALARGRIKVGHQILQMIKENQIKKGSVLTVAKIAGIMGAKRTSDLIPMCHQVPLQDVQIDISANLADESLIVEAKVEAVYRTGVEMESLLAVSVTLLTIYDMCKSVNKSMTISDIRLTSKTKTKISVPQHSSPSC